MSFRVGIDTGGAFTDAIAIDERGNIVSAKTSTTPEDLKSGIMRCIDEVAGKLGMDRRKFLSDVTAIVHGTIQGTNVIGARSGPRLGIISTEGQEDTVQLRRVTKENMWDWRMPFPEPLVARHLRIGVQERLTATGEVLRPLNEESVIKAVAYLKSMGVKHIVVTALFSFVNPAHENKIREIIKREYPEAQITLSNEILSAAGEYERFSTAVIDAYIHPAIEEYIKSLKDSLGKQGFKGQLFFIQNNGGIETDEIAAYKPCTLLNAGPAAGPETSIAIGRLHGYKKMLSLDMGNTNFDIAVVTDESVMTKNETVIHNHRFCLPVVNIETLGSGAGSIAWFDMADILHVGPRSAGANPGPACYGRGGTEATLTDAAVVLGYISPDNFLGGKINLNKGMAEKVIKEKVAGKLGMSPVNAAAAIYQVYNSVMSNALLHSFITKGHDAKDFVLCTGGSAGSLCALKIAEGLGMKQVLIARVAPVYSSFGMLGADLKHNFTRFYRVAGNDIDLNRLKKLYQEMETEATLILDKENVPVKQRQLMRTLRLRYYGQFRDVDVEWPNGPVTQKILAEGMSNFHRRHKELYGTCDEKYPLEFMSFGLTAIGKMPGVTLKGIKRGTADASSAIKGTREAYFEESNGFVKTRIYDGSKLLAGNLLKGPCIVEEAVTSTVIPPGVTMCVDDYGNYITK